MFNIETIIAVAIIMGIIIIGICGLIYIAYKHHTNKMVVIEDTDDVDELEYIVEQIEDIEEMIEKSKKRRE